MRGEERQHIAQLYGCVPSPVGPIQTHYCWNGQKDQKEASKVGGLHWNRVHGWKYVHRGGKWQWIICDAYILELEQKLNTCFGPCNKFILSTMMNLSWEGSARAVLSARIDPFWSLRAAHMTREGIKTQLNQLTTHKYGIWRYLQRFWANFGHFGAFLPAVSIFRPKWAQIWI